MKTATATKRWSTKRAVVLVAHEYSMARDAIKHLACDQFGNIPFVDADDGDSLARVLGAGLSIRLAIVDLDMPRMDGGLRLADLAQRNPTIPFVALSVSCSAEISREILSIPTVRALVTRKSDIDGIRLAIETAMLATQPSFTRLREETSNPAVQPSRRQARQEQIRYLLSCGMSNKTIAATLLVSEGTVKNQITNIFKVLNVSNRLQAARRDIRARK